MSEKTPFIELPISEDIQQALAEMGFTDASPIQSQAIPVILAGRDVIGQAQTGTGKTGAFGIPLIQMTEPEEKAVQTIVLCPTRELAVQVCEEIKKFSKYKRGVKAVPVYGGASIEKQIKDIRSGANIVVGTPGRVIDHIERGTLNLNSVRMIVLDEADEMLNMGFVEDIERILEEIPEEDRQTVFFSATMPKQIMDLTKRFQNNPEIIKVKANELTVTNIEQFYYEIRSNMRTEAMARLIDMHGLQLMLVFCNTKLGVDSLVEELLGRNLKAEGLHGDMRQQQRQQTLSKFKSGIVNILVATDVAARGIDVNGVDAVFNYDVPLDEEYYVHRIGRTGRAGRFGKSFTFVTGRKDILRMKDIERYTKSPVKQAQVPNREEIEVFRVDQFIAKTKEIAFLGELDPYLTIADRLKEEGVNYRELAATLIKLQYGPIGKSYGNEEFGFEGMGRSSDRGRDRDRGDDRGRGRSDDRGDRGNRFGNRDRGFDRGQDRGDRFGGSREFREKREFSSEPRAPKPFGENKNMVKLTVNVGKNQRVRPNDIVGAITSEANVNGKNIGHIDIYDKHTFVEVLKEDVSRVITAMADNTIKGFKVNVEIAK
jgi:ATP-dependent RNA helicase DeaD